MIINKLYQSIRQNYGKYRDVYNFVISVPLFMILYLYAFQFSFSMPQGVIIASCLILSGMSGLVVDAITELYQ